jgi:hypothetical protein
MRKKGDRAPDRLVSTVAAELQSLITSANEQFEKMNDSSRVAWWSAQMCSPMRKNVLATLKCLGLAYFHTVDEFPRGIYQMSRDHLEKLENMLSSAR